MKLTISSFSLNRIIQTEKNCTIVDTRPFSDYSRGHIPGAVNIDLFQFHWLDTSKIGIKQFDKQSRNLLSNIGVHNDIQTIFYDDLSGMSAARGVWLLLYFGHKKVSILDGGFQRWKNESYSIETKTNRFKNSIYKGKPHRKFLAGFMEVKRSLNRKDVTLVDARTHEEYNGVHVRAGRAGHIPNAINVDWEKNITQGRFKNPKELSKLYSQIPRKSTVITYCQGGYRAANTFVALSLAGYKNVKMYLGSWGEWGNKNNLPTEFEKS